MSDAPPKFIEENGVRRLNPAWKQWKSTADSNAAGVASSSPHGQPQQIQVLPQNHSNNNHYGSGHNNKKAMANEATALPVVSSLADQRNYLGPNSQAAPSYEAAIARFDAMVATSTQQVQHKLDALHQEQRMQKQQGLLLTDNRNSQHLQEAVANGYPIAAAQQDNKQPNVFVPPPAAAPTTTLDLLNLHLAKYEVPAGLLSKFLDLAEFNCLRILVDDSGSMSCGTDSRDARTGRQLTRWQEVHIRLGQFFDVLCFLPLSPLIRISFLNITHVIDLQRGQQEHAEAFHRRCMSTIDNFFRNTRPARTTPALEKITEMLNEWVPGSKVSYYFFGDGQPDRPKASIPQIVQLIKSRECPELRPFCFLSCTNDDEAVEWMRDCEEAAKFCSEIDDYNDESREILRAQGAAFPFTEGLYLASALTASFSPHDLDCMDEGAPMSKKTLETLLGYVLTEQEFAHYHREFLNAAQRRGVKDSVDILKRDYIPVWKRIYPQLLTVEHASDIEEVKLFQEKLVKLRTPACGSCCALQ